MGTPGVTLKRHDFRFRPASFEARPNEKLAVHIVQEELNRTGHRR